MPAQPGVFLGERLVALEGGGEPGAQRGIGRPLAGGDGAGRVAAAGFAQLLDLLAEVGLGIEPGPGDACFSELNAIIDIDRLMVAFRTRGGRL